MHHHHRWRPRLRPLILVAALLLALGGCGGPPPITPLVLTPEPGAAAEQASFTPGWTLQEPDAGPVGALAFSADGAEIRAVYGKSFRLCRWRSADRTLGGCQSVGPVGMGAIAFDGAGRLVATSDIGDDAFFGDPYLAGTAPTELFGPRDGVHLIDAETGELTLVVRPDPAGVGETTFNGVALSRDGQVLAAIQGGQLMVWRLAGAPLAAQPVLTRDRPAGAASFTSDLALDAEGRLLAMSGTAGQIQLWDTAAQRDWGALPPGDAAGRPVYLRMAIDPGRQALAAVVATDRGAALALYSLGERELRWRSELSAATGRPHIYALSFSPRGSLLAAGTPAGVQVWRVATGELVQELPGEHVYAVAFSPDGARLAWGDASGAVHIAEAEGPNLEPERPHL